MAAVAPVERLRCNLCLAILSVRQPSAAGVHEVSFVDRHTPEECARATAQRIKVLEEMHHRDARELESQAEVINELGQWVGLSGQIIDAGRKWLEHRQKRAEDLARLRGVFQTGDRQLLHPLFASEEAVAEAIRAAILAVDRRPQ